MTIGWAGTFFSGDCNELIITNSVPDESRRLEIVQNITNWFGV
jgi:hypothetical protein